MATPFLTKLLVPARRAGTIRRARLLDRLAGVAPGEIAVVRAPAGFGKTTLLTDFAEQTTSRLHWLALDEWDRDVSSFLRYLRLALTGAAPGAPVPADDDPGADDVVSAVAALVNSMVGRRPAEYLVLDDFHCLDGAAEVAHVVDLFIRRLPPSLVLIIAGRTWPEIASLPRLRATGAVTELGPEDLAFSADEVREVWRACGPADAPGVDVDAVLRATRGWPAAVSLACRTQTSMAALAASPQITDYLAAEVLGGLSAALQMFLLSVSTLDAVDVESARRLLPQLGEEAARDALTALDAAGIPLTWLTREPPRAALHPLLREFLQRKLRAEAEGRYRELHLAAARLAEEQGRPGEAVRHYQAAEAWDRALALIDREAPQAYRRGQWATILAWLDAVPEAVRAESLPARLWECRILSRLGRTERALPVIEESIARFRGSVPAVVELEALRAGALRRKGEVAGAIEAARRAKRLAFDLNATVEAAAEARRELGLALMAEGAFADALEELSAVLDVESQRGDAAALAYIHGCLGSAYGALGRLAESLHHLERARHGWRRLGNNKELSWVLNNLGVTYWQLGQDEQARESLADCLRTARQADNRRIEGYALATLGDIERLDGALEQAEQYYREALEVAREGGEGIVEGFALAGLADVYRRRRQLESAEALAGEALASAQSRGAGYEEGLARLVLARVARDGGCRQAAIEGFLEAERLFEKAGAFREQAEALLFLAESLLAGRSGRPLLRSVLGRIPELAARVGWHRFLARHPEAAGVAAYAVSRRIEAPFYQRLLRPAAPETGQRQGQRFPRVALHALGRLEAFIDGRRIERAEWESEKSAELILLLLLLGRPAARDEIIASLWPDAGGSSAVSVFHTTLHRARRALYREAIVESSGGYTLQPEASFECDVLDFRAFVAEARRATSPEEEREHLRRAYGLYGGPLAPSLESEWVESERRQLEETWLRVATRLAVLELEDGRFEAAAQAFEAVLGADPYSEAACAGCMRAYAAMGDDASALRVYQRFARVLQEELGEEPHGEAAELYVRLRGRGSSAASS